MQLIQHLCGRELERCSGSQGAYLDRGEDGQAVIVERCPDCGEALCDTDCTDRRGTPLPVENQTDWSRDRRRSRGWKP